MLRSRQDQGEELEPLNPRHPDSLAASPSRTPTPSPAPKRPRPSPLHGAGGGASGSAPHGATAVLPEYLEGLRLEEGGAQPRPLPLWQLLLAGGLLLTVALVAVDYEMEVSLNEAKGYQGHAFVRRAFGSAVKSGLQRPLRAATAGRAAGAGFKPRGNPAVPKGRSQQPRDAAPDSAMQGTAADAALNGADTQPQSGGEAAAQPAEPGTEPQQPAAQDASQQQPETAGEQQLQEKPAEVQQQPAVPEQEPQAGKEQQAHTVEADSAQQPAAVAGDEPQRAADQPQQDQPADDSGPKAQPEVEQQTSPETQQAAQVDGAAKEQPGAGSDQQQQERQQQSQEPHQPTPEKQQPAADGASRPEEPSSDAAVAEQPQAAAMQEPSTTAASQEVQPAAEQSEAVQHADEVKIGAAVKPIVTSQQQLDRTAGESAAGPNVADVSEVSKLRVLVAPTRVCQLVTPALEERCEALGQAGKDNDTVCAEAYGGQYQATYLVPFVAIAGAMRKEFGFPNYQVQDKWPERWLDEAAEQRASGEWSIAGREEADVIIVGEVDAPLAMRAVPDKVRFIILQGPSHASLSEGNVGTETLSDTVSLLQNPRVVAYLQHTSLSPLELNNQRRIAHSVHYTVLDRTLNGHEDPHSVVGNDPEPTPWFTPAMLAKVHTLIPLIWRWRHPVTCHGNPARSEWMQPSLDQPANTFPEWLPKLADREIDVAFTGAIEPGEWVKNKTVADLYRQHRRKLLDAMTTFKAAHPELRVEMPERMAYDGFAQLLRRTKLFVSPWGFGEYSGKDFESGISRALLVKPLASMFTAYPPIYRPNVTCVEVAVDFSDLELAVLGALADLPAAQRMADAAYLQLVEHTKEANIARDVAALLRTISPA